MSGLCCFVSWIGKIARHVGLKALVWIWLYTTLFLLGKDENVTTQSSVLFFFCTITILPLQLFTHWIRSTFPVYVHLTTPYSYLFTRKYLLPLFLISNSLSLFLLSLPRNTQIVLCPHLMHALFARPPQSVTYCQPPYWIIAIHCEETIAWGQPDSFTMGWRKQWCIFWWVQS